MKKEAKILHLKVENRKNLSADEGAIDILFALHQELLQIEAIIPDNLKAEMRSLPS